MRVLSHGGTNSGSSRVPVVTSISSGKSVCSNVSCVTYREQNERTPLAVELNCVGSPLMRRKFDERTLNEVTKGTSVVRRQIKQWQFVSSNGVSWTSYRIAPQKHPPMSIGISGR